MILNNLYPFKQSNIIIQYCQPSELSLSTFLFDFFLPFLILFVFAAFSLDSTVWRFSTLDNTEEEN